MKQDNCNGKQSSLRALVDMIARRPRPLGRCGNTVEPRPGETVPREEVLPARYVVQVHQTDRSVRDTVRQLPYEVRPLFEGADPSDAVFRLAEYYIVRVPFTRGQAGAQGHDVAYALRDMEGIDQAYYEGVCERYAPLSSMFDCQPPPADKAWSRKAVRLPARHSEGDGIVIGHPDTGWVEHRELDRSALDLDRQWNTIKRTHDAHDPREFPLFKAHGTSTATVIVSRSTGQITGMAPKARLIPIRCIDSVALVADIEVAQAIWYASQQGVDVISLSAGGFPAPYVEGVVGHAIYRKNIVFCAAAGNATPFVVYPAAYPDAIAVAGTTPTDRPSSFSSYGKEVTVSAPGHRVWKGDFDGTGAEIVSHGCGTSYAAPHVAGAAAIWLAHHGRDRLLAMYTGKASFQEVFKLLLRQTARNPGTFAGVGEEGDVDTNPGYAWNPDRYGAGILDVTALLAAPLPDPDTAGGVNPHDWAHTTWRNVMYGAFQDTDIDQVRGRLEHLVGEIGQDLDKTIASVGTELSQLFMANDRAWHAFTNRALDALAETAHNVEDGAAAVVATAGNFVSETVTMADQLARAAADFTIAAEAAAHGAAGDVARVAQEAEAAAQAAANAAATNAASAAAAAQAAAAAAIQAAANAATAATEAVTDAIEDAVDEVSDVLKSLFG